MARLQDKIVLLFLCILLHYAFSFSTFSIVPILIVISVSGGKIITSNRNVNILLLLGYLLLACRYPEFLYYLPVLFYDWIHEQQARPLALLFLFPICLQFLHNHSQAAAVFLCLIPAGIIRFQSDAQLQLQKEFLLQRDSTQELHLLMEQKNEELIIRQDQEIHIATLNERNRIARDIHDTVGHLLSSSLLQIGALQAVNQQEELASPLTDIKNTLAAGLDAVRKSVHDMHHDAIDLEAELQKLIYEVPQFHIQLTYDIANAPNEAATYHIIAIVKEALHNTIRHSNADRITILLREQPKFYQLVIHDNGSDIHIETQGIGLKNMQNRVDAMHGYFNFQTADGFKIFITLPKEENI